MTIPMTPTELSHLIINALRAQLEVAIERGCTLADLRDIVAAAGNGAAAQIYNLAQIAELELEEQGCTTTMDRT